MESLAELAVPWLREKRPGGRRWSWSRWPSSPAGYCVRAAWKSPLVVELLAGLGVMACCVRGGTEVATRAANLLAEPAAPAFRVRGGPGIAARAVDPLVELVMPASCVGDGPEVAARVVELLADPAVTAGCVGAAERSPHGLQSCWPTSACAARGGPELTAWAVEPLAELGALVCCWSDVLEVAARAVEPLAGLAVPACCAKDGSEIAARAEGLLAELAVPVGCVRSGPEVAAGRGVAGRTHCAGLLREWRSGRCRAARGAAGQARSAG